MTNEELRALMEEALTDDDKCLVLGDYLESRGIEISESVATVALAMMMASAPEEQVRKMRRDQRVADIRVRTREVIREMDKAKYAFKEEDDG